MVLLHQSRNAQFAFVLLQIRNRNVETGPNGYIDIGGVTGNEGIWIAGIPDPKAWEESGGYLCGLSSKVRHAWAMCFLGSPELMRFYLT